MASARRTSYGSRGQSFVGYAGIEVVSDEGNSSSSSGNYSQRHARNVKDNDVHFHEKQRTMKDISSLHSVSTSEMQPSIDVSSDGQSIFNCSCHINEKTVSTLVAFIMMVTGIVLVPVLKDETNPTKTVRIICQVIRAAGLFGFTGGITNWISIKLIFKRVSIFFCSGALVKHFGEAKETVSNFILEAFFSPAQVRRYVNSKKDYLLDPEIFDRFLLSIINSDTTATIVDDRLDSVMATPEGIKLRQLGVTKLKLRPLLMNYITDMRRFASPLIIASLQSSEVLQPEYIREQIVDVIATRSRQLTPFEVQKLVTKTIYKHLSLVVLWGNLFGAIIGCTVEIASIYTRGLPG